MRSGRRESSRSSATPTSAPSSRRRDTPTRARPTTSRRRSSSGGTMRAEDVADRHESAGGLCVEPRWGSSRSPMRRSRRAWRLRPELSRAMGPVRQRDRFGDRGNRSDSDRHARDRSASRCWRTRSSSRSTSRRSTRNSARGMLLSPCISGVTRPAGPRWGHARPVKMSYLTATARRR